MSDMLLLDTKSDPFALSRGERQKVALASVLAAEPEILLLDEPTTGLDYRECTVIMDFVKKLNEEKGITVVMVCHDMEVVFDYAKIVLRLMGAALPLTIMLTVTKMNDLSSCLVKILHVPYKYAFTLTTAMRFIPVFMNEMSAVSAEVRGFYLRGINSGYKSYGFGAMDFAAAVIVIIIVALAVLY